MSVADTLGQCRRYPAENTLSSTARSSRNTVWTQCIRVANTRLAFSRLSLELLQAMQTCFDLRCFRPQSSLMRRLAVRTDSAIGT
jgi:hypothetical protein